MALPIKPRNPVADFVERLRSKNEDSRHRAWIGLKNYITAEVSEENRDQIQNFMNQINVEIDNMRRSADICSKKGAVLAIDVLLNVDVGNTGKTISRSENHLKDMLSKETDSALLQMTATVMGQLALRAGQSGGNIVDFQCNSALEALAAERNERNEARRLAAVFILRELALCTPTLFYQIIHRFFDSIFKPIRDPKPLVRIHAVAALRAALAIVSQRENLEDSWYKMCYDHCIDYNMDMLVMEKIKPTKDDWSHGTLLILEELMRASNTDVEKQFEEIASIMEKQAAHDKQTAKNPSKLRLPAVTSEPSKPQTSEVLIGHRKETLYESSICRKLVSDHFNDICKMVLTHRNNRNPNIQQSVVSLLPRLAAFKPKEFCLNRYLKVAISYLTTLLKREKDKSSLFIALGLVSVAVGKEIRPYLDEILDVIFTALPKDMPQKKQKGLVVEPSVFTCISLLSRALGNDMQLKIRELIGPMFHVPLSPALTASLEDIAKQIPALRRDIQDGLLQMLSLILTGKPPSHPGAPKFAIQSAAVYDSAGISHDLTNITLALRTLGSFDFEGHSLTKLLRHCADHFLGSDNDEVRLEAVRTCCSLLSHTCVMAVSQASLSQTVAEVLNKLLVVGITDTEAEIRRCVLESLDHRFDQHLAQAENLASLFIALNDEVFDIRGIAMVMIGRLSTKNPAYVMPSLRKVLIQLMAVLEHSGIGRDKEQAANMLYLLVHNAPRIVKPYLDSIVDVLMSKLTETEQNTGVITSVLEALGGVSEVGGLKMLQYAEKLLPLIVDMLDDSTSIHKREVVVRTLGQVVGSTGMVVEPYNKFPNLLTVLLNLMVTEPEHSVRKEVVRLLGLLGALDPYRHKLNLGKIGGQEAAGAVVLSMWEPSGDRYDRADISTNEMLVSMSAATLDEFYPAVAIACMMRIINEPSLAHHHLQAVSAINFIFNSLGLRSVQYIAQVVPACLKVMRENESVREFLFTQLSKVISIVKLHIKPYLNDIFAIVRDTWAASLEVPEQSESIQKTMINLLRTTVIAIATDFKLYLPGIVPHMLKVFISDKSETRTIIKELLEAIHDFGINLDGYIHLLLPPIMQLLDQLVPDDVKELAMKTVELLTDDLDLSDFASKIIHPLVRLLERPVTPELTKQAMNTLCALVAQLGKKYKIFIPMVNKTLQRYRIQDPELRYKNLVRKILDDKLFIPPTKPARVKLSTEAELTTSQVRKDRIKPEMVIQACKGTTRASKDDWMEWLRRFNQDVLKMSSDPSLRACQLLAQSYSTVARELFNSAFVSCWTELPPEFQTQLASNIEGVLEGQKIPEITQTILNLAEFMEHCDSKGALPISPAILGEQAVECRAYAKALHYIEEEFHEYVNLEKEGAIKGPNTKGMKLMEKLISVNNKLQQREAAHGVLLYAKKKIIDVKDGKDSGATMLPGAKIPGDFYEKLHQWEEAKRVYEEELRVEAHALKVLRQDGARPDKRRVESKLKKMETAMLGKMRCLEELGEWRSINDILSGEDVCSWKNANEDMRQTMSRMGAASAWGLDDCRSMAEYVNFIPKDSFDGLFYRAVLKIMQSEESDLTLFPEAHEYISKARDLLSTELAGLASESYSRAYGAMVNVQMLTELEEVITYRLVEQQKECIKEMWWKRMNGCQKTVEDWSKLLRVHLLVLTPIEDSRAWIKFAGLCRQNGRLARATDILKTLRDEYKKSASQTPIDVQLKIELAILKHTWELQKGEAELKNMAKFVQVNNHNLALCKSQSGNTGRSLLAKCYLKLGSWTEITYGFTTAKIQDILGYYREAVKHENKWYKAWHSFAYASYEAVQQYKGLQKELSSSNLQDSAATAASSEQQVTPTRPNNGAPNVDVIKFCVDAVDGFFKSISLSDGNSLQDTLRLLTLWFEYGDEGRVYDALVKNLKTIKIENWLQVIPQLIARIDTNRQRVGKLIQTLLCDICKHHPQSLIYPLTVAAKSSVVARREAAQSILQKMEEHDQKLVAQARLVSEELIRVAILWHELWHEGLEEASRLYFGDRNIKGMFETLEPLHQMLERGPQTQQEVSFQTTYGTELAEALGWCKKYQRSNNVKDLTKAWDSYYHVFRRITKQLPMLTSLELQLVSPKLLEARDLELAVPGTYDTREVIGIQRVSSSLQVITSKQRPRKLSVYGSNGKEYQFVLKGHEDLRQDERVMQLFGLVNSLLLANTDTCRRNLTIQRYSAIPLSPNSGLLGWVPHCDTLHSLIRDYREKKKILLNIEHRIMMRMAQDYEHLTLIQKIEVFEYALDNTKGDDLAKIIWFKSPTSEVWFDRRTNYTRSLAVMSMVGYVLGLGDRHPSNLMLDRESGKIIHIDFGDCFEVAMSREKFPEKIPFRLTRMLINAMEVTGIDGNYRMTCERVMKVLRSNKDSVMAVLEAFVYDPLLNWWLMEGKAGKQAKTQDSSETNSVAEDFDIDTRGSSTTSLSSSRAMASLMSSFSSNQPQGEVVNQKALNIVQRVKDKLTGRDFTPSSSSDDKTGVSVEKQIDLLIEQATSHANLCQCYIGWCPFW